MMRSISGGTNLKVVLTSQGRAEVSRSVGVFDPLLPDPLLPDPLLPPRGSVGRSLGGGQHCLETTGKAEKELPTRLSGAKEGRSVGALLRWFEYGFRPWQRCGKRET